MTGVRTDFVVCSCLFLPYEAITSFLSHALSYMSLEILYMSTLHLKQHPYYEIILILYTPPLFVSHKAYYYYYYFIYVLCILCSTYILFQFWIFVNMFSFRVHYLFE